MSTTDAAVRDDAQFRGTHSDEVLVEVNDLKMFFPVFTCRSRHSWAGEAGLKDFLQIPLVLPGRAVSR